MNILFRDKNGQEVFGGITSIHAIDSPLDSRNRIMVYSDKDNAQQEINLNECSVELLPENAT